MFKIGDKVLVENYSLHKDDCLTVCKVLTEQDMIDIIDLNNYVFTGKKCYILKEVCNLFDEDELTLYEDKQE